MAPETETTDRDVAVRAMLVREVDRQRAGARVRGVRPRRERFRAGVVTAVALAVVVALSVIAIRFGADRGVPAGGGLPTPSTVPAGVLLGRYTSADGPKQTHVIHPDGRAIAAVFACAGVGDWMVHIEHDSDLGGVSPDGPPGDCAGSASSAGRKGVAGSVQVRITTAKAQRWTLTVVGIPETYVTPQPISTPTDTAGTTVPFCPSTSLTAALHRYAMPKGVTEVDGGQIVLTNTSGAACALAGWPMVRFVDAAGAVLGRHTIVAIDRRMSTRHGLQAVILQPGGRAYTQIDWYLPNYYASGDADGRCVARTVHTIRIDLGNRYAGAAQQGSFELDAGTVTACLNGRWGVNGEYGQLSATEFVSYSAAPR